jgi:hypothetical protein
MDAIDHFRRERQNQVLNHMYDDKHDAAHDKGELVSAALCYATAAKQLVAGFPLSLVEKVPSSWPFQAETWRPTQVARTNLRKAGALLAAEWDRLDKAGI